MGKFSSILNESANVQPAQVNNATEQPKTEQPKSPVNAPTTTEITAEGAKKRIQECIDGRSIVVTEVDGKMIVTNATNYNVCVKICKHLRALGGEFDKENLRWSIPAEYWNDPSKAVATKSEKRMNYEKRVAERAEKGEQPKTEKPKTPKTEKKPVVELKKEKTLTLAEARESAIKMLMELTDVSRKDATQYVNKYIA